MGAITAPLSFPESASKYSKGIMNASDFPDPVGAIPMTSSRLIIPGMVYFYIAVGAAYWLHMTFSMPSGNE